EPQRSSQLAVDCLKRPGRMGANGENCSGGVDPAREGLYQTAIPLLYRLVAKLKLNAGCLWIGRRRFPRHAGQGRDLMTCLADEQAKVVHLVARWNSRFSPSRH